MLSNSTVEKTGANEFLQYADIAPIIDLYGVDNQYTISFDIRSADTTTQNTINIYNQNGTDSKYSIGVTPIPVTTTYTRHSVVVKPTVQNGSLSQAMLAFYGGYGTGNIPSVKNVSITLTNDKTYQNFVDSGLSAGFPYSFRVRAVNAVGASPNSNVASATPFTTPAAPLNLTATAGVKQVTLSWTAPSFTGASAITDYRIEYSSNGGVSWSIFNDGVSANTTTVVTGLADNTTYNFRVSAINGAGVGAYYDITSVQATTMGNPPSTPSTPTATATAVAQITLSWTAPNDGGSPITGYDIQYRPSGGTWTTVSQGTTTNRTFTSLANGTTYEFQVRANNAAGSSSYSSVASATTWNVPGVPTNLTATPNSDSVILSWTAPASTGGTPITDYQIEYCTATSAGVCTGSWTIYNDGTSTNTTATVSGLGSSSTTYYNFRVSAINAVGTGPSTAPVTAQSSYITVSTSSDTVSFQVIPATADRFNSMTHDITVKTNNPLGYDLRLSTNTTHSNLVNINNSSLIINPTSASATSPVLDLPVNTWGYRINNTTFGTTTTLETNVPTSQYTWAKVQPNNTPDTILTSNNPTITGITIPIYYGLKVNATQTSGTYRTTVVYTAVTK
ncbi:MAG: fibronectin type III domain-containing protein [Candidatus Nanosyncoccaceae bacterium]